MTTAARPTFDPAKGGSGVREKSLGKLSQQLSSRDQPAHLTLKERVPGQDTIDEVSERDLRAELEDRERVAQLEKSKGPQYKFVPSLEQATQLRLALRAERDKEREAEKEALLDGESIKFEAQSNCPTIINARKMAQLDADEDFGSIDLSESDFEDDDGDDDDPAELMAELEKIKQERLAEEEKRDKDLKDRLDQVRSTLGDETPSQFAIKRRWDDDVPFKNCARDEQDPKRKVYLNDTLRQDFHKRFMDKYIR